MALVEIEHHWDMPPDPKLGCVSDDGRYLVVVDGGSVDAPGRYKYSIVDLQTGNSSMYDDVVDINVSYAGANIFAMNGYVWVVGCAVSISIQIFRIHPSSGAISTWTIGAHSYQNTNHFSTYSKEHNSIYITRRTSNLNSSFSATRFDCSTGTFPNASTSSLAGSSLFYSTQYDVLYYGASVRLDPINLSAVGGSLPSLSGFNNTTRTSGGKIFTRSNGSITVHTDTGSAWTSSVFSNVAAPSNNNPFILGANDDIYTADNSKLYLFKPVDGTNSVTDLAGRGNRGTAIPVGGRVYVPAGVRSTEG